MGLKNSPATFVRLCESVFPPEDFKTFRQCFLDDLCVFCKDFKELLPALDKVLKRIIFKSQIATPKISSGSGRGELLGSHHLQRGSESQKEKSRAERALLPPRTFNKLQKLTGVFQYFKTFIPNYLKIARPLMVMLSPAKPFVWSLACQSTFETLKEKLCLEPILTRYRPDLQCILDCNYQGHNVAAMLGQKHSGEKVERAIAYTSRPLTRAEQRYTTTEGELLALLHGLNAFRQYLTGRQRFLVHIDHRALKWIRKLNPNSGRLARWLYEIRSTLILRLMSNIVQASCTRCPTDS
jgi:hypothetical protein